MSDKLSEVHMVDNPMGSHNDEGGPPDIEANISQIPDPQRAEAVAAPPTGGTVAHVMPEARQELERQGIQKNPEKWKHRQSTVKGPEHYRRPTVALNRMQAEVARREAEEAENSAEHGNFPVSRTFAQRIETGFQHRLANGLQRARAAGYVSDSTVVEIADMNSDGSNPFAVCNQDIDVQLGFRRKLLGLLLLNLLTVLGLMFLVTCTPAIYDSVKDKTWIAALTFFAWGYSLVMMFILKDKYPWNYVMLVIFTLGFAAFFGCGQRAFLSYSNFQIVCNACVTTFCLIICLTTRWSCAPKKNKNVLSHRVAAMISWFIGLIAGIIVQVTWLSPSGKGEVGHFVSCQVFSALATWYFAYDTWQIERRLTVDDYMLGVINFYTDFLLVVVCCCCMSILMGGD